MMSLTGDCSGLAFTGLGYSVLAIAIVAIACLAAGIVVVGHAKQRSRLGVSVALLLVLGLCVTIGMAGASSARAATSDCGNSTPTTTPTPSPAPSSTLTLTQTSTITSLAPGIAAATISGTSTNNGLDNIFVEMVEVRIDTITKAPHAAAGTCDASDYILLNPQMAVNQSVPPHGSVQFTGATLGFNDRSTNQDACKGATVRLTYELYES
jgi:hypothetical protein